MAAASQQINDEGAKAAAAKTHSISETLLSQLRQQPRPQSATTTYSEAGSVVCTRCGRVLSRSRRLEEHLKSDTCSSVFAQRQQQQQQQQHQHQHQLERKTHTLIIPMQCKRCNIHFLHQHNNILYIDRTPLFDFPDLCPVCREESAAK